MSILLQKNIDLRTYEVLIEYSIYEKKKLLHAAIQYIHEQSLLGVSKEADIKSGIARDLLFGSKLKAFANRMISELMSGEYVEIIDGNINITELGEDLIETGSMRIRYQDIFKIQVVENNAIIEDRIVSIEPLNSERSVKLKDAINKPESAENSDTIGLNSVNLSHLDEKDFTLIDGTQIHIDKVGIKGLKGRIVKARIELRIKDEISVLVLKMGGNSLDLSEELRSRYPEITYMNVLRQLVDNEGLKYFEGKVLLNKHKYQAMSTNSEKLTRMMSGDLRVSPLIKFGDRTVKFEKINLKGLSFYPEDRDCADRWSKDMLLQMIGEYIDELTYHNFSLAVLSKFPTFDISLPRYSEATRLLNLRPGERKYWYIQAPIDLSMEALT